MSLKMHSDIIKKLNDIWIEVGLSKIHGVGIKAIRNIPKNTIVIKKKEYNPENYDIKVLLDNGLEDEVFDSIKKYYAHNNNVIQLDKNKINEIDHIMYLNHNKNPNLDYVHGNYITNKKVKKGEELTIDYKKDNYCRECIDLK